LLLWMSFPAIYFMKSKVSKKIIVLAERETFFLPHCVAQLGTTHNIVAIIVCPGQNHKKRTKNGLKLFGLKTFFFIAASELLARLVNIISINRYYSLRKVARRFKIQYENIPYLHSPECYDLLEKYKPDIIFTQLSYLIKPDLLSKGLFWNKHCSLLPAYTGVYPVFWSLLHGETNFGVTIHEMNEQFDRGRIIQQSSMFTRSKSFFSIYHALYDQVPLLMDKAIGGKVLPDDKVELDMKSSYYSFPQPSDRIEFLRKGNHFGHPFRLHPAILPGGKK